MRVTAWDEAGAGADGGEGTAGAAAVEGWMVAAGTVEEETAGRARWKGRWAGSRFERGEGPGSMHVHCAHVRWGGATDWFYKVRSHIPWAAPSAFGKKKRTGRWRRGYRRGQ